MNLPMSFHIKRSKLYYMPVWTPEIFIEYKRRNDGI